MNIQRDRRYNMAETFPTTSGLLGHLEVLMGFLANSIELFTRVPGSMGIRYLNGAGAATTIFLALFARTSMEIMMMFTGQLGGLVHMIPYLTGIQIPMFQFQGFLFGMYTLAIVCMGVAHLVAQAWVNRDGIKYHTYFSGIPWGMACYSMLPGKDPMVMAKTLYEPLFLFGLSYYVTGLDLVIGWWLWFASISMFFRARLHYARARSAYLDGVDAQFEAEDYLASVQVLKGKKQRPGATPSAKSRRTVSPKPKAAAAPYYDDANAILADFDAAFNGDGAVAVLPKQFRATCPRCQQSELLPMEMADKRVECPCGERFRAAP